MVLFLSYNRADDAAVRVVREALHLRGVETYVDWNDLAAGLPWPAKLERALLDARAVAVFVGPSGLGPWQTRELYFALDLQVSREKNGGFPVIPVMLAGAEPPTGFLALNTWVDLRDGVSESSLTPLLRMIEGAEVVQPRMLDICPYRDLRAFREEDAALFFGRREAVEKLVQRVDASSHATSETAIVAVVGPSGSGKSSVVMAGVIPALRRQRPPDVVWDSISFTPGDAPWRRLADALMPLLDPKLTEARRLHESATLANALQWENGIGSAVQRVLLKSGGTDRLLIVVDQFEELFTLTAEPTAREFVRALLDASRSAPMTLLLTMRSDYYGKAISLDHDLSNALPAAQVNLGPIRPRELRDVIEKPAMLADLTFDPGLVDHILYDVGNEPGSLPLLEYALTELWKARSGNRLTFDAYKRISGVSGALANRADLLYAELSESQRVAARRLMMRLVRVTAADEEGADTRRRARREELDNEAWKLVPFFTSPRARLLVASEDTVEVSHETLIKKWDRLRAWIEEDRRFLLWRQQLAVYRTAWIEGGESADTGTLLRGALLGEARTWLRTRRAELSPEERKYIDASEKQEVRSKAVWIGAAAVFVIAVLAVGAWALYQHSSRAVVNRILDKRPERFVIDESFDFDALATLIKLGRLPQIEIELAQMGPYDRPQRYAQVAAAVHAVHPNVPIARFVDRAMREARSQAKKTEDAKVLVEVADNLFAAGRKAEAMILWREAETIPRVDVFGLAASWAMAGDSAAARDVILRSFRRAAPSPPKDAALISKYAYTLATYGDRDSALALADMILENDSPISMDTLSNLAVVEAITSEALLTHATGRIAEKDLQSARMNALASAPELDVERLIAASRAAIDRRTKEALTEALVAALVKQKRFADLEAFSNGQFDIDLRELIGEFAFAERPDEAARTAERFRKMKDASKELIATGYAAVSMAFARAGRSGEASKAYDLALAAASAPEIDKEEEDVRDGIRITLVVALAARERHHEAFQLAESIVDDDAQWVAYLAILEEIAFKHRGVPLPP